MQRSEIRGRSRKSIGWSRIALRSIRATMRRKSTSRRRIAMSSLASKQGPRYRHTADGTEPYETIGVEKLTPIIGAEISGVDIGGGAFQPHHGRDPSRARRKSRDLLPRSAHHPAAASRLRPQVRRTAHPSRRAARGRRSGADEDLCRQGFAARQRRGLAYRRVLRRRAADGLDPLHPAVPAARRRHAVRQHVCGLRIAVGPDEDLSRRADRAA